MACGACDVGFQCDMWVKSVKINYCKFIRLKKSQYATDIVMSEVVSNFRCDYSVISSFFGKCCVCVSVYLIRSL